MFVFLQVYMFSRLKIYLWCFLQIPAGDSTRTLGVVDTLTCKEGLVTLDLADCLSLDDNIVTAAVLGGGVTANCDQKCTNGSTCYSVDLLSTKSDNKPLLSLRGGGSSQGSKFRCCTTNGNNNNVNCGKQQCAATATGGSNSNSECCTVCRKSQATSIIPGLKKEV